MPFTFTRPAPLGLTFTVSLGSPQPALTGASTVSTYTVIMGIKIVNNDVSFSSFPNQRIISVFLLYFRIFVTFSLSNYRSLIWIRLSLDYRTILCSCTDIILVIFFHFVNTLKVNISHISYYELNP